MRPILTYPYQEGYRGDSGRSTGGTVNSSTTAAQLLTKSLSDSDRQKVLNLQQNIQSANAQRDLLMKQINASEKTLEIIRQKY